MFAAAIHFRIAYALAAMKCVTLGAPSIWKRCTHSLELKAMLRAAV